ncbi:conserved hypothetical protein [metagenome]|uniref:RNA polymerase sigma factor 70 region 4 type 2 domain-containing protein n=1 Tax=metagenome TaxID=256318 RepID=A0A2P2CAP7_9ZZZZ
MRNSDDFDAFYKATRDRLLLQTFALTGDLPASRRAIRDAYVAAWHHWRKVERQADPESWVRPHAWADAQRRHSARIWHRDKRLDSESRATLDALAKLTQQQRRVLILNHLSATPIQALAREVGLTQEAAERTLQSATSQYALNREVASTQVLSDLNDLGAAVGETSFARPSIIRRAGTTRRRAFTAVGVAVTVGALVGTGFFVTDRQGVSPNLADEQVVGQPTEVLADQVEEPRLEEAELLGADQVTRLSPKRTWSEGRTSPNTAGDGLYSPCQGARFADPKGTQTLVRDFRSPTPAKAATVTAMQASELSRNTKRAQRAYQTTVDWYAGCLAPSTHLLRAYDVQGVGDEASMFLLSTWGGKEGTLTAVVARTGQVTTTTLRRTVWGGGRQELPDLAPMTSLAAAAVNRLCGTPGAGSCAAPPRMVEVAPPPVGSAPGLLSAVDLPQAGSVVASWAATEPRRAMQNLATIACDNSDFSKAPVRNGMTRSFLIVNGDLPERFGITQTVGNLSTPQAAGRFVDNVRKRMGQCEDKDLASTVTPLSDKGDKLGEIAAWRVATKINDTDTIDFMMAIIRRGRSVAQIGFVTAPGADYDRDTFLALAQRASGRLAYMPR